MSDTWRGSYDRPLSGNSVTKDNPEGNGWYKAQRHRPEQMTIVQRHGVPMLRAEVRYGDTVPDGSDTPCLLSPPPGPAWFSEGQERWIHGTVEFPDDWIGRFDKPDEPGAKLDGGGVAEFHHAPTGGPSGDWNGIGGSAPIYLVANDKTLDVNLIHQKTSTIARAMTVAPLTRGRLYDITFHILFSSDAGKGFIEVILDGKTVIPRVPWATLYPPPWSGAYLMIGLYRRGVIGQGVAGGLPQSVFHGEWSVGPAVATRPNAEAAIALLMRQKAEIVAQLMKSASVRTQMAALGKAADEMSKKIEEAMTHARELENGSIAETEAMLKRHGDEIQAQLDRGPL